MFCHRVRNYTAVPGLEPWTGLSIRCSTDQAILPPLSHCPCLNEFRAKSLSPLQAGRGTFFHTFHTTRHSPGATLATELHMVKKMYSRNGARTLGLPFRCSTDRAIRPPLSHFVRKHCHLNLASFKGSNPVAI